MADYTSKDLVDTTLAIGNLLIGVLEGWLLIRLFSVPSGKAIPTMIGANYFSAWIGGLFLRGAIVNSLPLDLNNGWRWFWLMVVMTFFITVLLEYPFVFWLLRGDSLRLRRSINASLSVQGVSYVLLFGWYWVAGNASLYTRANVVAPDVLNLPDDVVIYFISAEDGTAYRRGLRAGAESKVFDLQSKDGNDRLIVRPNASGSNRWDVVARLEGEDNRNPRFLPLLTNLPVEAAREWRSQQTEPPEYPNTWFNFGTVPVLGGVTNRPWSYGTGFWAAGGLQVENRASGSIERFAFETPFGAWMVRNAVQLPNDQVIFQLGRDQICAFDPRTKNVALLFRGRGPVPVIEKGSSR